MTEKSKRSQVVELGPNEEVVYEDDISGYILTETPDEDGDYSIFNIYDEEGYNVDEFWEIKLTPEEKEDVTKNRYVMEKFEDCIRWDDAIKNDTSEKTKVDKSIDQLNKGRKWDDDDWDDGYGGGYWGDYGYDYDDRGTPSGSLPYYKNWKPRELTPEEKAAKAAKERELIESLCKTDTIVFHQTDKTTTMLDPIYAGKDWDVYKGTSWDISDEAINEIISRHDRVVCLGHGTPRGLLSGMVGKAQAEVLKGKKIFAIWCYAATYFKDNGFTGQGVFCSDNCPSEVWECKTACDATVSKEWIYENMVLLGNVLADAIELSWTDPEAAVKQAREAYHKSYDTCTTDDERKVVEFNTNTLQVV